MNQKLLKNIGIYAGILLLFIGLAYGFTPEVLDGKIVEQSDIVAWKGMANEAVTHNEAHPEDPTAWSNSMFGGMPTTATIDSFEGDWTDDIYDLFLTGRRPASYLLLALIGGFLLMLSLGTSKLIAVGGAIAMAFCSYNFQIITAGHNTKMQAIAYFPWVLAGLIFTYKTVLRSFAYAQDDRGRTQDDRGRAQDDATTSLQGAKRFGNLAKWLPKTFLGATLFAFALSMQIKANHPQITYSLAMVIFVFATGLFIYLCTLKERKHLLKRFFVASALLLGTGLIGIGTNANKLMPTLEYSKSSMRGGSELSSENKDGLSLKYATEGWSYGLEEMPNLMIPDYNGGASKTPITESAKSDYANTLRDAYTEMYMDMLVEQYGAPTTSSERMEYEAIARKYASREEITVEGVELPTYWGPQQYTAGPMYMGAITIFLFTLGLILCKGREKWWLLAAIIVSVFLAWGEHFMWFTKLWFEYAPMYNKFRTVSMALIVLQVAMPMLGFVVLDRIMKQQYEKRKLFIAGGVASALTAGFCLICILNPNIAGTHVTDLGASQLSQWLADYRKDMLVSDATRSLVLILIAAALIALPYLRKEFNSDMARKILAGCVIAVVLFDLWGVGKRYLNSENFITEEKLTEKYFSANAVDKVILQDPDPNFRVLDIDRLTSSLPSYHHKCIGGYSAVKMQRYEDMLDSLIIPEIYGNFNNILSTATTYEDVENRLYELDAISMLNGKYIVWNGIYVVNPYAYGNCWFVDSYVAAKNPDEELDMLKSTYKRETAVIGEDFAWAREKVRPGSLLDDIHLTHYAPNELRYDFSTSSERAAIFSEIYYPAGWKAWIEPAGYYGKVVDGRYQPTAKAKEVDIFRANWILRGVVLPEGEGTLIMRFEPESYKTGENISRVSSILLILLLLGSAGSVVYFSRRKR